MKIFLKIQGRGSKFKNRHTASFFYSSLINDSSPKGRGAVGG